ncbi:MAG: hypothetical protein TEF_19820 [Rhizobiales bacterium NRL2]|jgi:sulfur-oxidizing protein SoxY|nr:MAG: hypothetical protein TEF_19820 [Rhizobiales bacterium NRL2]
MKPGESRDAGTSRRRLLGWAVGLLTLGTAPAALAESVRNRLARFRQTFPTPPDPDYAERMVARVLRGREPAPDLIELDLGGIAENGESVPLVFDVNCAMEGSDYPAVVHIFVIDNPFPEVARYRYGPWNGSARTEMRMRMRQSSEVVIVAEMADGRAGLVRKRVEVLAGACG